MGGLKEERLNGDVAQLVVHLVVSQEVEGSSPFIAAKHILNNTCIDIQYLYTTYMKFNIRATEQSYFKRRLPTKGQTILSVTVTGFDKVSNHTCIMNATYDDGKTYELTGRINLNSIKGTWTVTGYNPHGKMVICDVIED